MKKLPFLFAALVLLGACNNTNEEKAAQAEMQKQLADKDKELQELRQLAEIDRQEMENQYAEFALQYDQLKKTVRDTVLIQKMDTEKKHAEELAQQLRELKDKDANNIAEIKRLKEELETVRAVLRSYIQQVDSLQRLNQALVVERDQARQAVTAAHSTISTISAERDNLSQKVNIAAQLDATGIVVTPLKKNGKPGKAPKDITRFSVSFTIAKNVTAASGNRSVYVRLLKPNNAVMNVSGQLTYENKQLEYSAMRTVEYTGMATSVQLYVNANEILNPGTYRVQIFCGGQMIGSGSTTL